MNTEQQSRYSRHLLLPGIQQAGQERIMATHVFIIGLGGLGAIAAQYLWEAGIGHLTVADGDHVEQHNLPRQVLYREEDIGYNKAICLAQRLQQSHPGGTIQAYPHHITTENIEPALFTQHHYVLDCTDDFKTRYLINALCYSYGIPLISAAIKHYSGYLHCFDFQNRIGACYACVFPKSLTAEDRACQRSGVLSTAVASLGLWQSGEVLKRAAGCTKGDLMVAMDFLTMQCRQIHLEKDPACTVCGCRISDLNR